MGAKWVDLTGKTFGELTVLGLAKSKPRGGQGGRPGKMRMWRCRCKCGTNVEVETGNLKRRSPSCGCLKLRKIGNKNAKHGLARGGILTPEYRAYRGMLCRCRYGRGRSAKYKGMSIAARWLGKKGPANFLADMGPKPSPLHSLDRKDGTKGYSPGNCQWATPKAQSQNRKNVRWLTLNGKTQCVADWARELRIDPKMIYQRLKRGMSTEAALKTA